MPRFALLIHDSPRGLHYDLLLESGDVLKTWALPQLPVPGVEMECEALADHRPLYLDHEGPISGGRGSVMRFDHGTYHSRTWTDREITIEISGEKIRGAIELRQESEQTQCWRLVLRATDS
jgi:hypothetical protein